MIEQQTPDREQKIAEIREALEKATPGPWKWVDPGGYDRKKLVGEHEIMNFGASMPYSEVAGQEPDDADAHLIANAPEWLRFLLSERDAWARQAVYWQQEERRVRLKLQSAQQEIERFRQERAELIEGLRIATDVLGTVPMNDARLWGVYNKLCDILKEIGVTVE